MSDQDEVCEIDGWRVEFRPLFPHSVEFWVRGDSLVRSLWTETWSSCPVTTRTSDWEGMPALVSFLLPSSRRPLPCVVGVAGFDELSD